MRAGTIPTLSKAMSVALLLGLAACGTEYDYEEPKDFPEGSGQEVIDDSVPYAPGPYGFDIGSVVPNYAFYGYAYPEGERGGPLRKIELGEFYNPTGTGVFGPGGGMPEGAAKPLALVLSMSAVWCQPCNYEASSVMPGKYTQYKPLGGEFFVNLADSSSPGTPANQASLDSWIDRYNVDYPMAIDPAYKLGAIWKQPAWPANYIVDARSMRIATIISGVMENDFWMDFEDVLDGTFAFPE